MSSNYHKQTASNDKNSSVARNQSKHSKSKALKKSLKAELRERASLVIHKNSAKNTITENNTKEHGSSRALEDIIQLSKENQKADHYIDAAYPRTSYSKPEASSCPIPCKKYGESPIPKRTVALDPVGIKIEHLFATMKSPINSGATSTISRNSSAPTLEKNLPPTPAKNYANYPIKEKQKQYCTEPVSEISTTTSNNLCANFITEENLSISEAPQRNHPASPALSPEISRAKENMLETTHEIVKLSTESQFFQAKTGEFAVPLGYRLGFRIVIAIAMMLIATGLVTYLGFSDFGNYGVGVSMEEPIKPHLEEQSFCFNDFPNEVSPPEVHDFLQTEISCRDDRTCPRRGRCYGGRLHDCTDGSDGEHGFNLFVPNERGDACVPSVEAVEYVKTVEGALLRLTAADACVQWRIPRDHYYPTFGLLAVVDEVNIDNHNVKPEFLPWLILVLNSSRVIMEICSGLGDKNIGVMGLGPGVPPSELPLPFSCAATVKLSAWLRRCNHQLAAIYYGL